MNVERNLEVSEDLDNLLGIDVGYYLHVRVRKGKVTVLA